MPPINVVPNQGKLLNLLACIQGARRILEVGTLGGYSTIWLERALPADDTLLSSKAVRHAPPRYSRAARAYLTPAPMRPPAAAPATVPIGPPVIR